MNIFNERIKELEVQNFLIGKVHLGQSPYYESEFTYNDECIDPKVVLDMLKFADYFFF